MTSETHKPNQGADEIDLGALLAVLRRRLGAILGLTGLMVALAGWLTLGMAPKYTAEARVLIEEQTSTSSLLGQLTNLPVDLMGLVGGAPQTAAEMEVLMSYPVVSAVVGPQGTSDLVPQEGLNRLELVDDLSRQSVREQVKRAIQGREHEGGMLAVEVTRWDFPKDLKGRYDPLLIKFEGPSEVRVWIDRLFNKKEQVLTLAPDGAIEYEDASLVLIREGDLSGRKFRLTFSELPVAVGEFLEKLVVDETERGSNVLRIAFPDREAGRAAQTVNALVRSYLAHNRERFFRRAERSSTFITEELERVRADLRVTEEEMIALGELVGPIVLPESVTALMESIIEVDLERAKSNLRSRAAQSLLDSIHAGELTPADLIGIELSSPNASVTLVPLAELFAQRRALEQLYTEEWPALKELQGRIEDRVGALSSTLEAEVWREARLAEDFESILVNYRAELEGLPQGQMSMARLERQIRALSEIYIFLLGQEEQTRFAQTASVPNVQVIQWALPPSSWESPMILLNLAVALILGLILGTGFVLVREASRRPIWSVAQLEGITRVPCLVGMPRASKRFSPVSTYSGPVGDANQTLRAGLTHLAKNAGVKTLAVISASADKRRSSVAAGIACTLARSGERVLLVDGDLGSPSLPRMLGVEVEGGLADALEGNSAPLQAAADTEVENLSVMAAGTSKGPGHDLLGSMRLQELIGQFSEAFDRVIIHTPALSDGAAALDLATCSDGTLWVVRAGHVKEKTLKEGCRHLDLAGAATLGTILVTR